MIITEINPKGDFDSWSAVKLNEIKLNKFNEAIGKTLFENNEVKLWEISLEPNDRIPFRRHSNNYSCTSFSEGLLISRNINGQVGLIRLEKGDSFYWECATNEMIHDLENVGDKKICIKVLEEKMN